MESEQEYTRAVYEVVLELMRQLLIHDEGNFDYAAQDKKKVAQYADPKEQLKILSSLEKLGVIELRSPRDFYYYEGFAEYDSYEVITTREKLHKYATTLSKKLSLDRVAASMPSQEYDCYLRLDEEELKLKLRIGNYNEYALIKFQPISLIYKIFKQLSKVPPGTSVGLKDIDHKTNEKDVWQVITKGRLDYLEPFFKRTEKKVALKPSVLLSGSEIAKLVPQNNAKYRKIAEKILSEFASVND